MLQKLITVQPRFQRSIRLDTDLNTAEALTGFICPASSIKILLELAEHTAKTKQGAFTWTGPYGSGKSSLAILLAALLSPKSEFKSKAIEIVGQDTAAKISTSFPYAEHGYIIVPVMGSREDASKTIASSLHEHGIINKSTHGTQHLLRELSKYIQNKKNDQGVVLIIDEMGKFLEGITHAGQDLHVFQELAELANRSEGKFIVLGVLHQAFSEYTNKLSLAEQDEWAKIQGRYVDIVVNPASEEQIYLIGQAIKKNKVDPYDIEKLAQIVTKTIKQHKTGSSPELKQYLIEAWPLHPIVTVLLTVLAGRRFGQNQRSIFGFLNSAEPFGFQDFLQRSGAGSIYEVDFYWNYLKINFEPLIINSSDGHRWTIASDTIERCSAIFTGQIHAKVMKTIALLDMFRQHSGLPPTKELLQQSFKNQTGDQINEILKELENHSFIVFREHLSAYAIFAGSDFDIEAALDTELAREESINTGNLQNLLSLKAMLAKRHYFDNGTQRWADIKLISSEDITKEIRKFIPCSNLVARYLLVLPQKEKKELELQQFYKDALTTSKENGTNILLGHLTTGQRIVNLYRELQAYSSIRKNHPELQGDQVARREIGLRESIVTTQLNAELEGAFLNCVWYADERKGKKLSLVELNNLTSEYADKAFPETPIIHNELLNRNRPSGSAVAGQNSLLRLLVENEDIERLGIEGYPVEAGLYDSIIEASNLHKKINGSFKITVPTIDDDPLNLFPMWQSAIKYLKKNKNKTVELNTIQKLWTKPPFGVKNGLLPLLSVLFILSIKDRIAVYREGLFRHEFTDIDVDYLSKSPKRIQLRWVDFGTNSAAYLSALLETASEFDKNSRSQIKLPEAIEVARLIVKIFDELPEWTKRTSTLSKSTSKLRTILQGAKDPNELLFIDIPKCFIDSDSYLDTLNETIIHEVTAALKKSLNELVQAYGNMLNMLKDILLRDLSAVYKNGQADYENLQNRAKKIAAASGDFRVNAFINRLSLFDGSYSAIEGIASLASNKPPKNWVDIDFDRAKIEIAKFARDFIKTELYSTVKNSAAHWHSYAFIYREPNAEEPVIIDYNLTQEQLEEASALSSEIAAVLDRYNLSPDVVLAALSDFSGRMVQEKQISETKQDEN